MNRVWKAGGLLLIVGTMVWLVTLWQWQNADRDVTMADIVVQLLLLPVLLVAVIWFTGWAVQRMRQAPPKPVPAVTAAATPAAPQTDEALQVAHAWVLAEAVSLPLGDEPVGVLTALRESTPPALDPVLVDADGLPVFTARGEVPDEIGAMLSDDADGAQDGEAGATWPPLPDGLPWSEGARRALWRLSAVAQRLVDVLCEQLVVTLPDGADARATARLSGADVWQSPAYLSGVAPLVTPDMVRARAAGAPLLTVRLVLPTHWRAAELEGAVQWLRARCAGMLDWAQANHAQGVRWLSDPLAEPETVWQEVDQLMCAWQRDPRPQACLLLAADSALDPDVVSRWQSVGALFTAQHQGGRMPGEAAVGLLLAHPMWPGLPRDDQPLPRLYRAGCLRRDKSADAAGRVAHNELDALLGALWPRLQAPLEQVQVVTDADHRGSRAAELFQALQAAQPDLDPTEQVVRAGVACGDTGAARALLAVSLAAAAVRQGGEGTAALAILMQSSHERVMVALAQPAPAEAPT